MALVPVVATPVPNRSPAFVSLGSQSCLLLPSATVADEDVSRPGIFAVLGIVQRGSNDDRVETERYTTPELGRLPRIIGGEFGLLFPSISFAHKDVDGTGESHLTMRVCRRSDGKGVLI